VVRSHRNLFSPQRNNYSQLIATTLLITIPEYDASIFVDQLQAGNLLDAIGDPIAADVALLFGRDLHPAQHPVDRVGSLDLTPGDAQKE
jgi:hypothetical protein